MQDWAFYPHTNGSVLAAGIFLDDVDEENGCARIFELAVSAPACSICPCMALLGLQTILPWGSGAYRPTMVIPGSHRGPVYDHHTDGLFVGGIDVVVGVADGCDFASAAKLCGPAGSVSVHHVRTVHGSDHNRSDRPRRILFVEFIGADAWPLLGCKEFGETPVGEGTFSSRGPPALDRPWWHHAPAVFDADTISLRSTDGDCERTLRLTLPASDGRGTPVMGTGVSVAPRYVFDRTGFGLLTVFVLNAFCESV